MSYVLLASSMMDCRELVALLYSTGFVLHITIRGNSRVSGDFSSIDVEIGELCRGTTFMRNYFYEELLFTDFVLNAMEDQFKQNRIII